MRFFKIHVIQCTIQCTFLLKIIVKIVINNVCTSCYHFLFPKRFGGTVQCYIVPDLPCLGQIYVNLYTHMTRDLNSLGYPKHGRKTFLNGFFYNGIQQLIHSL